MRTKKFPQHTENVDVGFFYPTSPKFKGSTWTKFMDFVKFNRSGPDKTIKRRGGKGGGVFVKFIANLSLAKKEVVN